MPARRYRYTWDDLIWIDADYMAGWGAFTHGCKTAIDFHDEDVPKLAYEMDDKADFFRLTYGAQNSDGQGGIVHARVEIERRPCRFGGARVYFAAPCCGRSKLKLAILHGGPQCGQCARITWKSRRENSLNRLMRKANKIAVRLACEDWSEAPINKPLNMRHSTYSRLIEERTVIVEEITRKLDDRTTRVLRRLTAAK